MFYGDKILSFCRYKMQLNILVLVLVQLASMAKAYFITVDAHAEECFFDKVKSGTKMGLMFEVAEGGFLDIDVRIVGPDGKTIHQVQKLCKLLFISSRLWHSDISLIAFSYLKPGPYLSLQRYLRF